MNKVVTEKCSTKPLSNRNISRANNKDDNSGKKISPSKKLSELSITNGKTTKKNGKYPASPHPNNGAHGDLPPDHLLNDPEVLAKIGNRAVKTVTNKKPTRNCDKCKKPLTDDGCTAFGKVYHKDCFKCSNCKKKLEGKFFSKGEDPFCSECYKATQETCCVCENKISGDCVVSGSKFYHPGCITCHVCGCGLRGSYMTYMDKPICTKDYENVQKKCTKCQEIIDGTYYTLDGEIVCEKDYMDQVESCNSCGKEVIDDHVHITGATFHPKCFNCQTCGKNMDGESFSTDDKMKIYCPEDYAKKFGAVCCVCKKAIVPKQGQTKASRLRVLGKDFHIKCFRCEDCGMILDSDVKGKECYPIKDHILCIKCNEIRQDRSEEESDQD